MKLRQRAQEATLPGYAESLVRAAEDVERQAEKLEERTARATQKQE